MAALILLEHGRRAGRVLLCGVLNTPMVCRWKLILSTGVGVAVCCSVLQCVAVCCSVLQCVAVCCSVLQCVAVCDLVYSCRYTCVCVCVRVCV